MKGNGEMRKRFSIRKLSTGTCSIVIGSLMVMAGTQTISAQTSEIQDNKVSSELDSLENHFEINDNEQAIISDNTTPLHEDETSDSFETEENELSNATMMERSANQEETYQEWYKSSENGSDVNVVEENSTRYNEIYTVPGNDNNQNIAVYHKDGLQVDEHGNASIELELVEKSEPGQGRFGVMLHYNNPSSHIFVGYDSVGWYWEYKSEAESTWYQGNRSIAAPQKGSVNRLAVSLTKDGQLDATVNGAVAFPTKVIPSNVMESVKQSSDIALRLGSYGGDTTKVWIKTDNQTNLSTNQNNTVISGPTNDDADREFISIASDTMTVRLDNAFPRIRDYTIFDTVVQGQVIAQEVVTINGHNVKPETVKVQKIDDQTLQYELRLKDAEHFIDATVTLQYRVQDDELHYDVIKLENHNNVIGGEEIDTVEKLIREFDLPGGYFVSMSHLDENAQFSGARMSTNTRVQGDIHETIEASTTLPHKGYMYAFLNNDNLVATVWSNSHYNYGNNGDDYTRLTAQNYHADKQNYIGLKSSPYVYQRAYKNKVYDERTFILPSAKVKFAQDVNGDGVVNWQDGAIKYRDIMNHPYGHESVPNLVAHRIAMNFGSQAQNPFLTTLDNIKKVDLHTDGLGQFILLKGYQSEGHDSGHLDYDNIGERIGGAEDFKLLLSKAKPYGARIGIHVNASETYPESKAFDPDLLAKNGDSYRYGWNWLDQAININAEYDLAHNRYERFKALKEIVGDDLDFVYVDVWGVGHAGDEHAWMTHILSQDLAELGWRVGYEYGQVGEYDATFQHWAADVTYGDHSKKGINSVITRFIRNHQKDSWVGHHTSHGGAAVNPLLGGYDMRDFEGWQGRSNYKGYITNLFKTNVPTKFVQHFEVMNWIEGDTVQMGNYQWTPEMEVRLADDNGRELIIQRKSNDVQDAGYQKRIMTLDGIVILDEDAYLIPWEWTGVGEPLAQENHKLYHFSQSTGKTRWKLPQEWQTENQTVYLYELTDQGRINETAIAIDSEGYIQIDAQANTPYVLYKTSQGQSREVKWSEYMHVQDAGFNSNSLEHWEITGEKSAASIVRSQGDNPMLALNNQDEPITLSQTLTDLKPNTTYAAYIGVDNRSDETLQLMIDNGNDVFSNYTNRSIAKNYVKAYAHSTAQHNATVDNTSYFQHLYVFFTTGEDVSNVQLKLNRTAGEGITYLDDIRIFENHSTMFDSQHNTTDMTVFKQDFENTPQGIFPFVIGPIEGVEDNRTHLAQKNDPYTQRGWNGKKISDVVEGDWSIKTNGLVGRNQLVYQTIPQNFRFESGKYYRVTFDYENGSDDAYAYVIGQGEYNKNKLDQYTIVPLKNTWENSDKAGTVSFIVEGNEMQDTWIGIFSTSAGGDNKGDGWHAAFRGYNDFILDNLVIEVFEPTVEDMLEQAYERLFPIEKQLYTTDSFEVFANEARKLIEVDPQQTTLTEAKTLIQQVEQAKRDLVMIKQAISWEDIERSSASAHPGDEFKQAFDGNLSTLWHTPWSGGGRNSSATIELKQPMTITGLDYVPRSDSSVNGRFKSGHLIATLSNNEILKVPFSGWENNGKVKSIDFDTPLEVIKLELVGTDSYGGDFLSAAELRYRLVLPEVVEVSLDDTAYQNELKKAIDNFGEEDERIAIIADKQLTYEKFGLLNQAVYDQLALELRTLNETFENQSDKEEENTEKQEENESINPEKDVKGEDELETKDEDEQETSEKEDKKETEPSQAIRDEHKDQTDNSDSNATDIKREHSVIEENQSQNSSSEINQEKEKPVSSSDGKKQIDVIKESEKIEHKELSIEQAEDNTILLIDEKESDEVFSSIYEKDQDSKVQAKIETNETKTSLPETGEEASYMIFSAAALMILSTVGLVPKKQES